jgi:3-amino-4-hydroxybenzoic acid synthase
MDTTKLCWLDIRSAGPARAAIVEEAVHQRVNAIVADDPAHLTDLPPSVMKVLFVDCGRALPPDGVADVVLLPEQHDAAGLAQDYPALTIGRYIEVTDAASLDRACRTAGAAPWTVLRFRDPTKIPLEIVIAASTGARRELIAVASDVQEAEIILGVLESGPGGVMMAAHQVGDATDLKRTTMATEGDLPLVELSVVRTTHAGMGERACVDTCSQLRTDEGLLVGSYSKGMIICVSETHPLPYMPTRPFRVNAGAIHSYTLAPGGRTRYLSELRSGSKVLAVDAKGKTRAVTVGRVKIESRPLISIDAVAPDGQAVNLILQDDWHVRVLGPGASVLNSTDLAVGDLLLGYLPTADRHVGYPINEFCLEL